MSETVDVEPEGATIKQVHPAARKQPPVVRTTQVAEQARMLWQVLRNYAQADMRSADNGYYWDGDVEAVAKTIFVGVAWDHSKHVSNFLRPILGHLQSTGNAKILGKVEGAGKYPFRYRLWIRDDWSIARRGAAVVADRGYQGRVSNTQITCPCGETFLTNPAYSQHKRACSTFLEREAEALRRKQEQDREEGVDFDEFIALDPSTGIVGMDYDKYREAMKNTAGRMREAKVQSDKYEAALRSLKRDWDRRTPDSLANLFDTLDRIVF